MGVKEYRFLTRTMKTIGTRSNKLAKAKEQLTKNKDDLKSMRKRTRRLRAKEVKEISHLKKGVTLVKEEIAHVEANRGFIQGHEWDSAESLRKEINATCKEMDAMYEKIPFGIPDPFSETWPFWKFIVFIIYLGIFMFLGPVFLSDTIAILAALIVTILLLSFQERIGRKKFSPIDRLRKRLKVLRNRERLVKKHDKEHSKIDMKIARLDKRLSKIDSELKNPGKAADKREFSELESDIVDSIKLRNSTKKEIKLLEKEIPQLWDSIAHLIPFSTALEKA